MRSSAFLMLAFVLASCCGAVTAPEDFPVTVIVTSGNTLEYKSGDIMQRWVEGDSVTFDYIEGVLCLDGLPHFPHPKVMMDERILEASFGNVPYVLEVFDSSKEYPWNHAVRLWGELGTQTTYAAAKAYADTRDPEKARNVLLESGLLTWVEITMELGHLALKCQYKGVEGYSFLSLRDQVPEPTPPPTLSPDRAKKMAAHLISLITDNRTANDVLLVAGNEQVTGRRR